jgi:RecJ-like exonuclease
MSGLINYDVVLHPAGPCKHCGGTGKIVLLTSSRTCGFCGGSGKIGELTECYHSADTEPKELAGRVAMVVQVVECVSETRTYGEVR